MRENVEAGAANPRRRNWLVGAVAVGAVAAGAGVAWWRQRPQAVEDGAIDRLWTLNFDRPQGGALSMATFKGRPLLVNFWATWCPPCVEEMPLLDAFFREQAAKGWQVLGLAVDQPSSVRTFLQRRPVTFPIGMAGLEGTELARSLGNATGGLPYSVLLDAGGEVRERRMGRVTEADLRAWARQA